MGGGSSLYAFLIECISHSTASVIYNKVCGLPAEVEFLYTNNLASSGDRRTNMDSSLYSENAENLHEAT
jgi:hypothetical protein